MTVYVEINMISRLVIPTILHKNREKHSLELFTVWICLMEGSCL